MRNIINEFIKSLKLNSSKGLTIHRSSLQLFFENVVWYGSPFVEDFLSKHKNELEKECHKEIWEKRGLGFKSKAHFELLQNDYQYLLAYIVYLFGDPGYYSFAINLYKNSVKVNHEALALLEIWLMLKPRERHPFTIFGVSVHPSHIFTKAEIDKLNHIKNSNHGISARLANIILGEKFIRESKINYKEGCAVLGFDPNWLINSDYYDGKGSPLIDYSKNNGDE